MKLHTERHEVVRSGVRTETEFRIKTTAKAFDILSSGLYTNPIGAIVRELSSNAYDAHVAAGKADEPFEIHLPSSLEPFFSVKDNGVGLSDEEIQGELVPVMDEDEDGEIVQRVDETGWPIFSRAGGLYTTYFDSTKTGSNDFIGALGLGSKSPFSYTNAFEVIARKDGVRRIYSVFLNEDGVPSVAMMGEFQTDECNGLEVKITVKSGDVHKFRDETASTLKWFPVKPTIRGVTGFRFETPAVQRPTDKTWAAYRAGYSNSTYMSAIQGNVEYRVNIDQLDIADEVGSFLKRQQMHIYGFFEIGELEVAASREEIRYDERSKAALTLRLQDYIAEQLEEFEKVAADSPSLWFAYVNLDAKSKEVFGKPESLRTFLDKALSDKQKAGLSETLTVYIKNPVLRLGEHYAHHVGRYNHGEYDNLKNLKRADKDLSAVRPRKFTTVFFNDMKSGGIKRISAHMKQQGIKEAYIITRLEPPYLRLDEDEMKRIPVNLTDKEIAVEFDRMIKNIGDPKVLVVTKDTKPVPGSRGSNELGIFNYGNYVRNRYRDDTIEWNRVSEDDGFSLDNGGLYFILQRGKKMLWNGQEINCSTSHIEDLIRTMVTVINTHGGLDTQYEFDDVYGVTSQAFSKIKKRDNWLNIFDLVAPLLKQYKDEVQFHEDHNATKDDYGLLPTVSNERFITYVNLLDDRSVFKKLILKLQSKYNGRNHNALITTAFDIQRLDRVMGTKAFEDITPKPLYTQSLVKHYPMMKFVGKINLGGSSWEPKTDLDTLFDYIKQVDAIDRS